MITVDGIEFPMFEHVRFAEDNFRTRDFIYCTCGAKTAYVINKYIRCMGCGNSGHIDFKSNKIRHYLLSMVYLPQVKNEKELTIQRYDLMATIDPSSPAPKLWVSRKGWFEFNYETKSSESFILKRNHYILCDNPSDLTNYPLRNYIKRANSFYDFETKLSKESFLSHIGMDRATFEKCDYLFTRTGVEELFFDYYPDHSIYKLTLSNMIKYLTYWCKYPKIEALVKSGHFDLVHEVVNDNVDLVKVLGKKRLYDLPKYVTQDESSEFLELSANELELVNVIHKNGRSIQPEFWEFLKENNLLKRKYLYDICDIIGFGFSNREIMDYLDRVEQYQAVYPNSSLKIWRDYLNMAIQANLSYDKFPRVLKLKHDLMSRENKYVFDEETELKFKENVPKWQSLTFSKEAFTVKSPESAKDLIEEGKELNHCVGSYIRDVSNEKTTILFVRRQQEPNNPYYTMEVRGDAIVQLRGKGNRSVKDPSLESFIEQYAENKKLKTNY